MERETIELEMKKGMEDAILYFRNKSVGEIEKEYEEVSRIIREMIKEYGTAVYDSIDYWYLLGWRRGVAKLLYEIKNRR